MQRLISGTLSQGELASLIETIFSSRKVIDLAGCLQESDVQTFVDVVHEVRCHSFIPEDGPSDIAADLLNLDRLWRTTTLCQKLESHV